MAAFLYWGNMTESISGFTKVAQYFQNASSVDIQVLGKFYQGSVEKLVERKAILYKVKNVDQSLIQFPEALASVILKVKGKDDSVRSFETKVVKKKLPHLVLLLPEAEVARIEREHERVMVEIPTTITLLKRVGDYLPKMNSAEGKIVNLSEGGCAIVSPLDLAIGDKINYTLEVIIHSGDKKLLEPTGMVKSMFKVGEINKKACIQHIKLGAILERELKGHLAIRRQVMSDF